MADVDRFREAASSLQEIAERYGRFEERPEAFLDFIHELDESHLQAFLDRASESLTSEGHIRPVVFLRFVVVERILDGKRVSADDIDEIKSHIDAKNVDFFDDYPELHDEIANQKDRERSAFQSWTLFTILHGIDYRPRVHDCKTWLSDIADFLREKLNLSDCDYHTAGFDYNQNFGTDHCWVAFYPDEAKDHQEAYQIAFMVHTEHFRYGIASGDRTGIEEHEDLRDMPGEPRVELEKMLSTYRNLIPRFHKLNRELLRDETSQKREVRRDEPLNKILHGPPGTGKTYSVQRRAVEIIEGKRQEDSSEKISGRFRKYLDDGQIEFVTFHPSYAYEEFVEGLRYDTDEGVPVVQDGILKRLTKRAVNPYPQPRRKENAQIWKISLGRQDNPNIFERCMREGEIAIGWIQEHNFSNDTDRASIKEVFDKHYEESESSKSGSIDSVNQFVNVLKDGDYVAVYNDPESIRAIGVVAGPYEYHEEYDEYPHVRPVKWLDKSVQRIYEMNGSTNLTLKTLYPLKRVSMEEFSELLPSRPDEAEPHVLIIDEINRGNLSRVFGELITLLEPDKRKGAPNEMSTRLPYSQDRLTLPSNLYVIGTMNTADRSIALLDAALRRRFQFEEMMPEADVIKNQLTEALDADTESSVSDSNFTLSEAQISLITTVFETLNERITALVDRDHQVGHSYFLGLESMADLRETWYQEVLPLLQEYFYEDHRRLIGVLGRYDAEAQKGFVRTQEPTDLLGDGVGGGEPIWEFHRYPTGELETALRNTFT
ncbi:MAG: AAA family ATPase [Salinibacter sp.]|uniref:AAA family ATPase n=1 Tax=Salinibacter sp. TaxID=2065818 RepID=UPI0035D4731A